MFVDPLPSHDADVDSPSRIGSNESGDKSPPAPPPREPTPEPDEPEQEQEEQESEPPSPTPSSDDRGANQDPLGWVCCQCREINNNDLTGDNGEGQKCGNCDHVKCDDCTAT